MDFKKNSIRNGVILIAILLTIFIGGDIFLGIYWAPIWDPIKLQFKSEKFEICTVWMKNPDGSEQCISSYSEQEINCPKFETDSNGKEFCIIREKKYFQDS